MDASGVDYVRPDTPSGRVLQGSDQVPALVRVAEGAMSSGDFATAISLYRKAYALEQQNVDVLVGLGEALSAAGAHNEALETFTGALKLDPAQQEALRGKGNALIALDEPEAAVTQFEGALALGADVNSYSGMGVAYDMMGHHRAAQACYRAGLDHAHDDIGLLNNLGLSLAFDGQYGEAITVLRKVASLPGATSRHRLNLALAYGLSGDTKSAAEVARQDLDETSVQNNLTYYRTLRQMARNKRRIEAVGTFVGPEVKAQPNPHAKEKM